MDASNEERDPLELSVTKYVEGKRQQLNGDENGESSLGSEDAPDEFHNVKPIVDALEAIRTRSGQSSFRGMSGSINKLKQLGDFRIIRELGRGSMGVVFEAEQESLERRVAIKVIPRLSILDNQRTDQFQKEAKIAATLHHTHIVPIFGTGMHDDYCYYVMQRIDGVGLDAIVKALRDLTGDGKPSRGENSTGRPLEHHQNVADRLARCLLEFDITDRQNSDLADRFRIDAVSIAEQKHVRQSGSTVGSPNSSSDESAKTLGKRYFRNVANIGLQVAEALAYAHRQNVLHRDIKPANLLLDLTGIAWVADFGLARELSADQLSISGDPAGTMRYMAPESLDGKISQQGDIYSLGLTLYELLTLRPAYSTTSTKRLIREILRAERPSPRRLNRAIPRDLETIIVKATSPSSDKRYSSAKQLAHDLRCFLNDRPILARRTTFIEHAYRMARRNPVASGLATATMMLSVAVAVLASTAYFNEKQAREFVEAATSNVDWLERHASDLSGAANDTLDEILASLIQDVPGSQNLVLMDVSGEVGVNLAYSDQAARTISVLSSYYERRTKNGPFVWLTHERLAEVQQRVGHIRSEIHQFELGEQDFLAAIATLDRMLEAAPNSRPTQFVKSETTFALGELLWRAGDSGRATTCFHDGLDLLVGPHLRVDADSEVEILQAVGAYALRERPLSHKIPPWLHLKLDPRAKIRWHGSEQSVHQAIATLMKIREAGATDPRIEKLLAQCLRERESRALLDGADVELDEPLRILRGLVSTHPQNIENRFELAVTLSAVNPYGPRFSNDRIQLETERRKEAEQLLVKITRKHPGVVRYVFELACVQHQLGELLGQQVLEGRRLKLALATGLLTPLEHLFPDVATYPLWRSDVNIDMAAIDVENGDLKVADKTLRMAKVATDAASRTASDELQALAHEQGLRVDRLRDEVDRRRAESNSDRK